MTATKTFKRIMTFSLAFILVFTFMPILPGGTGGDAPKYGAIVADAAGSGVSYSGLKFNKKTIDATVGAKVRVSIRIKSSSSFDVSSVRLELKGPKGKKRTEYLGLYSGSSLNGVYSSKLYFDHKDKGKWKVIGISAYSYWGTLVKSYRNKSGFGKALKVKSAPKTTITLSMPKTAKVGEVITLKATLKAGKKKLKGQKVYVTMYDSENYKDRYYLMKTDASGVASMKVAMPEADYLKYKVTYLGKKKFGVAKEINYQQVNYAKATVILSTPTSAWKPGNSEGSFTTRLTYNGKPLAGKYIKFTMKQSMSSYDWSEDVKTNANGYATLTTNDPYWGGTFDTSLSNKVTCTVDLDRGWLTDYNRFYVVTPKTAIFG